MYVKLQEAAKQLGFAEKVLRAMCLTGRVPYIRTSYPNGNIMVNVEDVKKALEAELEAMRMKTAA